MWLVQQIQFRKRTTNKTRSEQNSRICLHRYHNLENWRVILEGRGSIVDLPLLHDVSPFFSLCKCVSRFRGMTHKVTVNMEFTIFGATFGTDEYGLINWRCQSASSVSQVPRRRRSNGGLYQRRVIRRRLTGEFLFQARLS